MRRVDWFLAGVIGLFLAGGLIWQTLAWMGAVRLASHEAVIALTFDPGAEVARIRLYLANAR
jgi:hypothetical protein